MRGGSYLDLFEPEIIVSEWMGVFIKKTMKYFIYKTKEKHIHNIVFLFQILIINHLQ